MTEKKEKFWEINKDLIKSARTKASKIYNYAHTDKNISRQAEDLVLFTLSNIAQSITNNVPKHQKDLDRFFRLNKIIIEEHFIGLHTNKDNTDDALFEHCLGGDDLEFYKYYICDMFSEFKDPMSKTSSLGNGPIKNDSGEYLHLFESLIFETGEYIWYHLNGEEVCHDYWDEEQYLQESALHHSLALAIFLKIDVDRIIAESFKETKDLLLKYCTCPRCGGIVDAYDEKLGYICMNWYSNLKCDYQFEPRKYKK